MTLTVYNGHLRNTTRLNYSMYTLDGFEVWGSLLPGSSHSVVHIGLVIVSPRFVGLSTYKWHVTKVTNQLLGGMILQLLLHCCFGAAPRLRTQKHVSPYMPQNQHRASFWTWGIPSNGQMWMWRVQLSQQFKVPSTKPILVWRTGEQNRQHKPTTTGISPLSVTVVALVKSCKPLLTSAKLMELEVVTLHFSTKYRQTWGLYNSFLCKAISMYNIYIQYIYNAYNAYIIYICLISVYT